MRALKQPGLWLYVAALVVWGLVVLFLDDPTLRETSFTLLMYVGLASSLNILLGYTGYVSFGHIVFFGLGGYMGFYLVSVQEWSLYPAALVGGVFWRLGRCPARFGGSTSPGSLFRSGHHWGKRGCPGFC